MAAGLSGRQFKHCCQISRPRSIFILFGGMDYMNTSSSLELVPSVKKSRFRVDDPSAEHSDSAFQKLRPEILERDDYTCQCCGFKAKKWQEVHHIDNDHSNNKLSNLVTVCALCHMVFHIGLAGERESGRFIYIPPKYGVTQAKLNNMVRALWVHEASSRSKMDSPASAIIGRLTQYKIVANSLLGSSDPSILAEHMLSRMPAEAYERRGEIFKGFLLLPNASAFPKQIEYWRKEVFPAPKDWKTISYQSLSRWAENELGDSSMESIVKLLEQE